nr:unnamed protein product [Spirometra erinaceieuropaei]
MDGQLIGCRRIRFQSRVPTTSANNCALNAATEGDTQRGMKLFAAAYDKSSLIMNTEKKVVMHQPPPSTAYGAPQIDVNGATLGHFVRMMNGYQTTIMEMLPRDPGRQGVQIRRYKEILQTSPKRLQINSAYWEELTRDRLAWRRRVKTGAVTYEDNRTTAAKANSSLANLNCAHLVTPMLDCLRPAHSVNRCSGHESALLDVFASTTIPGRQQLMSPCPSLPRSLRRKSTPIALLISHWHLPPPQYLLR